MVIYFKFNRLLAQKYQYYNKPINCPNIMPLPKSTFTSTENIVETPLSLKPYNAVKCAVTCTGNRYEYTRY
jgi:hypothetical protein